MWEVCGKCGRYVKDMCYIGERYGKYMERYVGGVWDIIWNRHKLELQLHHKTHQLVITK